MRSYNQPMRSFCPFPYPSLLLFTLTVLAGVAAQKEDPSCFYTTAEECEAAALEHGLSLGGDGKPFESSSTGYWPKGCYFDDSTSSAFFQPSGTIEQMQRLTGAGLGGIYSTDRLYCKTPISSPGELTITTPASPIPTNKPPSELTMATPAPPTPSTISVSPDDLAGSSEDLEFGNNGGTGAVPLPTGSGLFLIRPGFRLENIATDSSDLKYDGYKDSIRSNGDCTYETYLEDCGEYTGTEIDKHVFQDDTITSCGRLRTESSCFSCTWWGSEQRCNTRSSESYSGSRTTSKLVPSASDLAALSVSRDSSSNEIDGVMPCTDVCMSNGQPVFLKNDESDCLVNDVWYYVDMDFSEECPVSEVCEELEVLAGCEDSHMDGQIIGVYYPLSDSEKIEVCNEDDVDMTRTVYRKPALSESDDDVFLFRSKWSDTWYIRYYFGCGQPPWSDSMHAATFTAGDEPFKDVDDSLKCYDGGSGNNKKSMWSVIEFRCNTPPDGRTASGVAMSLSTVAVPLFAVICGVWFL